MAESSRIFVRGLPPNIKEDEFKKHFSRTDAITDSKLIPHRRIGYVGYKTSEAAQKAVRYFNRSFIRMSRLGVELAKPVAELKKQDVTPVQTEKRKRNDEARSFEPVKDPRLEEFLQVMQPASKTKVWANEDGDVSGAAKITEDVPMAAEEPTASDDEYQTVPKKKRRISIHEESRETPNEDQSRDTANTNPEVDETIVVASEPNQPASNADWLRSKTSRVLGLLDDEELDNANIIPNDGAQGEAPEEREPPVVDQPKATSDAGSQTDKGAPIDQQLSEAIKAEDFGNTGRLFLRNLSYVATSEELRELFAAYGNIEEVHVPTDSKTGSCKGIAYVQFEDLEAAPRALSELDGKPFQGRLLHILPAAPKRENALDEYAISKLPLKKQQQIKRRAEAATASFKWNSLYMNADAVMASAAHRLGVSKSDILDPTSSDAAIKQAHAEINIIQETKKYFAANGVNLDSFKRRECSDTAILVKNFPFGTSPVELRKLFEAHGPVTKLLLPPAGTIAIVEFELPSQARAAFKGLAYRKIKDSVLFLEKAPKILFASRHNADNETTSHKMSTTDLLEPIEDETIPSVTYTLFVSNLNFSTTTAVVRDLFKPLSGFLSAQVKTKTDVKKPGQLLSMGFGFIEFRTKQDSASALKMMNGYELDGHKLQIKESHRALDAAEERRKEDLAKKLSARRSKLMVKNLPFEATKKDVRALFSPYGQLKSVRLPVKVGSMSTRGFAFADFVSAREAKNAMDTLQGTHLLGRRLNLEFAAEDAVDPEDVIEKMTKRAENQADKVALQKLASTGRRKKFIVQRDELDDN